MKKKLTKKLSLNKATVTRLQSKEMKVIKGASIVIDSCNCDTASCSLPVHCCGTDTVEKVINIDIYRG